MGTQPRHLDVVYVGRWELRLKKLLICSSVALRGLCFVSHNYCSPCSGVFQHLDVYFQRSFLGLPPAYVRGICGRSQIGFATKFIRETFMFLVNNQTFPEGSWFWRFATFASFFGVQYLYINVKVARFCPCGSITSCAWRPTDRQSGEMIGQVVNYVHQ